MGSRTLSRIELPARAECLKAAREFVDEVAASAGFDEGDRYDLRLAATEAVSNAIRHGAQSPHDTVRVSADAGGGALSICVTDSGTFRPSIDVGDSLPEQGRGLAFIAHLMDQLCIKAGEHGTVVRFSKRIRERR